MSNPTIYDKVKHIVVLMMENRSFDHIFGAFPGVNGVLDENGIVKTDCYNLPDPYAPAADPGNLQVASYPITLTAQPSTSSFNPQHLLPSMMQHLFGPDATGYQAGQFGQPSQEIYDPTPPNATQPATNSGFLYDYIMNCVTYPTPPNQADKQPSAMSYFQYLPPSQPVNPARLNVLHTLAENFCVCDNWFCDVPNNTLPNRMFMHAATCYAHTGADTMPGAGNNNETYFYNAKSIYEQLSANGKDWGVYGFPNDHNDALWFANIANKPQANYSIDQFYQHAQTRSLPFYSFLNLKFGSPGATMHPSENVQRGENFIAEVYNSLRSIPNTDPYTKDTSPYITNPAWEETLFVITFDENGGIFDHVFPATTVAPDGYTTNNETINYLPPGSAKQYTFDYTLLGPRVPALLISPWIAKGTICSTQLQNTSILRFAQDLVVGNDTLNLTERDLLANSFADVINLDTVRTNDSPLYIPPDALPTSGTDNIDAADAPPSHFHTEITKEFFEILPGHEDSYKPITREFATEASLIAYIKERQDAARQFYRNKKKGGKSR